MALIKEVLVTTTEGTNVTITVKYEDGGTQVIPAHEPMSSLLEPAAAKIQIANQLEKLGIRVELDRIIVEWPP